MLQTPSIEWSLLWPVVILALGGALLITFTSLFPQARTRSIPAGVTAVLAVGAMATLPSMWSRLDELPGRRATVVAGALAIDSFTIFVTAVICLSVFLAALLLDDYLQREGLDGPEWYVLLLLSAAGAVILASAEDLIVTFVGLEVMSIAVYVLAALHLRRSESQEAGFKYFILGALSSAIFLYGIALAYGATGSTSLSAMRDALTMTNERGLTPSQDSSMILVAMALMLVGFGFKVSAVPFQVWTPDVYEGSPTPVVAFMASAVKVAGFAALARVFIVAFGHLADDWRPVLGAMAVVSVVVGSFLAVVQTNVKRMLAFSSISHAGFMLIGVHAGGSGSAETSMLGIRALLFYMIAYTLLVAGTFAVATVAGGTGDNDHSLDDYRGLAHERPVLAAALVLFLLGQAGVPFTAGFFAKFGVIVAAVRGEEYVIAGAAMVGAVVGAFLYLRIIVSVFLDTESDADDEMDEDPDPAGGSVARPVLRRVAPATTVAIAVAVLGTLALGVFPDLLRTALDEGAQALSELR
ncbi:MAG: NADH-quinone oxidoreductase subunit N [Actinomycetota bacterium]|nr:NADH-quinone oxidoreductase subunit N [Actinomycetota bacterium]